MYLTQKNKDFEKLTWLIGHFESTPLHDFLDKKKYEVVLKLPLSEGRDQGGPPLQFILPFFLLFFFVFKFYFY